VARSNVVRSSRGGRRRADRRRNSAGHLRPPGSIVGCDAGGPSISASRRFAALDVCGFGLCRPARCRPARSLACLWPAGVALSIIGNWMRRADRPGRGNSPFLRGSFVAVFAARPFPWRAVMARVSQSYRFARPPTAPARAFRPKAVSWGDGRRLLFAGVRRPRRAGAVDPWISGPPLSVSRSVLWCRAVVALIAMAVAGRPSMRRSPPARQIFHGRPPRWSTSCGSRGSSRRAVFAASSSYPMMNLVMTSAPPGDGRCAA